MISEADLQRLRAIHTRGPQVLSLYMWVPADLPAVRGLPARADELLANAAAGTGSRLQAVTVGSQERQTVRRFLEVHARDWQGQTAAMFACAEAGLAEAFPLPCQLPDRAVLAASPHVRPLLAALQRSPAHYAAIVNGQHAWVLRIAGTRIDALAQPATPEVAGPGPARWYALGPHRSRERITQLAPTPCHNAAAVLAHLLLADTCSPLVIAGGQDAVAAFAGVLPGGLRDRLAGSFTAEPQTLTPAQARAISGEFVHDWVSRREQRLTAQITAEPGDGLSAVGLDACIAAVNARAVKVLVVADVELTPGFACEVCGTFATTPASCGHWSLAARPVPDLLEEMTTATLGDGGQVAAVGDCPGGVAALLRRPLAQPLRAS